MSHALGPAPQQPASSELAAALGSCRRAFVATAVFSGMSNLLMLTGALFMLEVYDRILPSRSVPTLVALLILVAGLYAAQGMIDTIRSRILVRVGHSLDESMSARVYDAIIRLPLKIGGRGEGTQPIRDLDMVRGFLSGTGPVAFFDLPWMPVYLAICFLFHTLIGLTALFGAVVLVTLTLITEIKTRHPTRSAAQFAVARSALLEASRRNAEAITAMGMVGRIAKRWHELNRNYVASSGRASDVGGGLGAISKVLRLLLQSTILGVGAWLVINQQSTPGIIIAGSILGARALAPVDLAIANWRGFVAARQGWQRLSKLLGHLPLQSDPMPLKPPARSLVVQNGAVTPPGVQKIVCHEVNFALAAGKALGVIGPTASGKSSLARMLVGVWRPLRGNVRLDGATLEQWSSEALGRHIGYVPQDVELFNGTVAQNISRFEEPPDPDAVIAAAQAAGVHELIINLSEGYDTVIGEHGSALSAGQAQRVALARALYRDPFLVVLDEPNSNLDAEGDEALTRAILGLRARGAITVVVAHRPSAIAGAVLVSALVIGLGGWASTAQISGALIAQGSIVVDSYVKKVQHPTGGVVGELFVRDGDHVKAGDVLLRLDETVTRANLAIVSKGLVELYARKARLAAERDGAGTMAAPRELAKRVDEPDVNEALSSERKLFELRHQDRLGQKQQLQERIAQLQQQIAGLAAQQSAKDKGLGLIEQELQGVRDLWQKNLVQLNRLTSLQREEAHLEGERGQIIAQAAEAKGKIAEIQLQIIQVDQDVSSDVAKEMREIDSKIGEYVERKVTAEDQLKRTDIRAPQNGIVFQSTANTVGGVVAAGDPIMLIVPESDNLMVEVKVDPKDIDQVQFGQRVVLRFTAFNVRTTPEVYGTVSRIAADVSTDQRTGQSYYLTRIAMTADEIKRLGDVKLTPGMPVEAFIETGERTMLSYLIKPMHDQLMRAFREK